MRFAAALAVMVAASGLRGDVLRWVNAAGGSFTDGANWDAGRAPTSTDSVVFDLDAQYTVTLPAGVVLQVIGVDVLRGGVTLEGAGAGAQLTLVLNGEGCRLVVGDGGNAAQLTVVEAQVRTSFAPFTVRAGGIAVFGVGGSYFSSSFSSAAVMGGGSLRVEGGSVSPGNLNIGGVAVVSAGYLGGDVVILQPTAHVLAVGADARFRYESGMTLRGLVEVTQGAELASFSSQNPGVVAEGCELRLSNNGRANIVSYRNDAASVVTLSTGAQWNSVGTSSEYRGPFIAGPVTTVRLSGTYFAGVEVDQLAVNSLGAAVDLRAGLTAEIDALFHPPTPVVRRTETTFTTTALAGPLTVRVRHPNALRIGDVIPILEHNTSTTGAFSQLIAPALGGGMVLEMYTEGTPLTTFVRVVAGAPSCYTSDYNGDGDFGTDQDIEAYFACLGGVCCATCGTADFNGDGDFGTDQDIEAFFRVLSGAAC